jgi:hypothetical protein
MVEKMAKKVLLVFAIITLVAGVFSMAWWAFILIMTLSIAAQFPGSTLNAEGYVWFYTTLTLGIILIAVSIVLFVVRAKRG